jgi:hypothetical protein
MAILALFVLSFGIACGDDGSRPFMADPANAVVVESFSPGAVYQDLKSKGMARVGVWEIWCKRVNGDDIEHAVIKVRDAAGTVTCVYQVKSIQLDMDSRGRNLLVHMKEGKVTTNVGDTGTFDEATRLLDLPSDP